MKKKLFILSITVLVLCGFASAQEKVVEVGDASFKKETYNSQLLAELNKRGAEGYKLIKREVRVTEALPRKKEAIFIMELSDKKYEYTLIGDASFKKETYNQQFREAANLKEEKGFKMWQQSPWEQNQEATLGKEKVWLFIRNY